MAGQSGTEHTFVERCKRQNQVFAYLQKKLHKKKLVQEKKIK